MVMKATPGLSAALLVLAVASCSNDGAPTPEPLKFRVIGSCTSNEGTLTSVSSGFTPDGPYTTEAWYPNGRPYTMIENPGYASASGSTPGWSWPCAEGANDKGDPPGTYKIKVTDLTSKRFVQTTLVVGKP
jgi:hypothetical protein